MVVRKVGEELVWFIIFWGLIEILLVIISVYWKFVCVAFWFFLVIVMYCVVLICCCPSSRRTKSWRANFSPACAWCFMLARCWCS